MRIISVLAWFLCLPIALPAGETDTSPLSLQRITTSLIGQGVLFVTFTVENRSDEDVRGFTLSCTAFSVDRTEMGTLSKTFVQILMAKTAEVYEGIEIGSVHPTTQTVRCRVVNDITIHQ
jgi:hypothetical protein